MCGWRRTGAGVHEGVVMNRRLFLLGASAVTVLPAAGRAADPERIEPVLLDDGRYAQSWFLTSFLVLKADLSGSTAPGKPLALLLVHRGLPYCKTLHRA